jgi:hypothetical protein
MSETTQNTGGEPIDWFLGRATNQITGNYSDISNTFGETQFTIKPKEDYWKNEEIQSLYKKQYGEKSYDKFLEDYDNTLKDYTNYQKADLSKIQTSERFGSIGSEAYLGHKERKNYFHVGSVWSKLGGSVDILDLQTSQIYDPRQSANSHRIWSDSDGSIYKVTEGKVDGSFSAPWHGKYDLSYMINNSDFADENGNNIIGFVYPDEALNPNYRGPVAIKAVRDGEYAKFAGSQWVNLASYDGGAFDYSLESSALWAVPKTINNFIMGFQEMFDSLGAAITGSMGFDSAREWFESGIAESKQMMLPGTWEGEQSTFDSLEGWVGFLGDIGLQLASGKAIGTTASYLSKMARGAQKAAQFSSTDAVVAKMASSGALTLYAAKDSYTDALAHGFSEKEASFIYFMNVGALFAAQRALKPLDKYFDAVKHQEALEEAVKSNTKVFTNIFGNVSGATAKQMANKTVQLGDELKRSYMKKMLETMSGVGVKLKDLATDKGYNLVSQSLQESAEESLEFIFQESTKILSNAFWGDAEYDEFGGKHFKSIYDEGYWSEFFNELGISAFGGAIGGVMAHVMLQRGGQNEKLPESMIDLMLSGYGDQFIQTVNDLHSKGGLGSRNLTFAVDEKGEFVPFGLSTTPTPSGLENKTQNDVVRDLILQQYNFIKTTVEALGGHKAFNTIVENYPELKDNMGKVSLTSDLANATKSYIDILAKNKKDAKDLMLDPVPDKWNEMSKKDKDEWILNQSKKADIPQEDIEKLIEHKRTIDDINSGEAIEKYYMQAVTHNTILHNNKDYGDNLLHKIMKATAEAAERKKQDHEDNSKVAEETLTAVKTIKPDLSNLEEVMSKIGSNGVFTQEAIDHLKSLQDGFSVSDEQLNKAKETAHQFFTNYYSTDNLNKLTSNDGTPLINSLLPDGQIIDFDGKNLSKDETIKLLSDNIINKISEKINSAKSISELQNVKLPFYKRGQGFSDDVNVFQDPQIIEELQSGDLFELEDFLDINSGKLINFKEEPNLKEIMDLLDLPYKLKELSNKTPFNPDFFESTSLDFLLDDFEINDVGGITSGKSILGKIQQLINESPSIVLGKNEDGTLITEDTFSDFESAQNLLNKLNIREAQITSMFGFIDDFETIQQRAIDRSLGKEETLEEIQERNKKYFNLLGLANLRLRQAKLNSIKGDKDSVFKNFRKASHKELINIMDSFVDSTDDQFTKIFKDTFFNPLLFNELKNKESLTSEEKETLDGMEGVFQKIMFILSDIKNSKKTLNELIKIGKEVSDKDNLHKEHYREMGLSVKTDIDSIDLILETDYFVELSKEPEVSKFVADFKSWGSGFVPKAVNKEILLQAYYNLAVAKRFIYNQIKSDPAAQEEIIKNISKNLSELPYSKLDNNGIPARNNALVIMNLDSDRFNSYYLNSLKAKVIPGVPLGLQEKVGQFIVTHMTSNASNLALSMNLDDTSKNLMLKNMLLVDGGAGTGKSSFSIGLGVSTGLNLLDETYKGKKHKVLLAANNNSQIENLQNNAKRFGISSKVHSLTFDSHKEKGDKLSRPYRLIEYLESGKVDDDIALLVFDEATFVNFNGDVEGNENLSDLAKISKAVEAINSKRGKGVAPLKVLLVGDHKQNGFTNEDNAEQNVSNYRNSIFATRRLTKNMRSEVRALTDVIKQIEDVKTNKKGVKVTNITSEYGPLSASLSGTLGGVRFEKDADSVFNDEEFVKNIEKQIEINQEERKVDPSIPLFTVGIIMSDGNGSKLPEDSLLGKLAKDNPHFPLMNNSDGSKSYFTHNTVQGLEFNYVIAVTHSDDIGDGDTNLASERTGTQVKLKTTISRAMQFAVVINETSRIFTSSRMGEIKSVSKMFNEVVTNQVREDKIEILENSLPEGEAATEVYEESEPEGEDDIDTSSVEDTESSEEETTEETTEEDGETVDDETNNIFDKGVLRSIINPAFVTITDKKLSDLANMSNEELREFLSETILKFNPGLSDTEFIKEVGDLKAKVLELIKQLDIEILSKKAEDKSEDETDEKADEEFNEELGNNTTDVLEDNEEITDEDGDGFYIDDDFGLYKPEFKTEEDEIDIMNESDAFKVDQNALAIMVELETKAGVVAIYPDITSDFGSFEDTIQRFIDLGEIRSSLEIDSGDKSRAEELRILMERDPEFIDSRKYHIIVSNNKDAFNHAVIVSENNGKLIPIGHVLGASNFVKTSKEGVYEISSYILSRFSPGKVKAAKKGAEPLKLSEFKLRHPNIHFSEVMVSTDKTSKFRGHAFVFYTFGNSDLVTNTEKLINELPKKLAENQDELDLVKGLKGGVGILRLNDKPQTLTSLFNQIEDDTDLKEFSKRINNRSRYLFADLMRVMANRYGFNINTKLFDFGDDNSPYYQVDPILSTEQESIFKEFLDEMFNYTNIEIGENGYNYLSNENQMVGYIDNDEGGLSEKIIVDFKPIFNYIINLDNEQQRTNLLTAIDKVMAQSNHLTKGLYTRLNAFKSKTNTNKLFAVVKLSDETVADEVFTVTSEGIDKPNILLKTGDIDLNTLTNTLKEEEQSLGNSSKLDQDFIEMFDYNEDITGEEALDYLVGKGNNVEEVLELLKLKGYDVEIKPLDEINFTNELNVIKENINNKLNELRNNFDLNPDNYANLISEVNNSFDNLAKGNKFSEIALEEKLKVINSINEFITRLYKDIPGVINEIIEEINVNNTDLATSTPTSTTQSIEAKKADIERRRQERRGDALEKIGVSRVGYDGKQQQDWKDAKNQDLKIATNHAIERLSKNPNVKIGSLPSSYANAIRAELEIHGTNSNDKTPISEIIEKLKEINAKYDAELKALESTPQAGETQTDVLVPVLSTVKIDLSSLSLSQLENVAIQLRRKAINARESENRGKTVLEGSAFIESDYQAIKKYIEQVKEKELQNEPEYLAKNNTIKELLSLYKNSLIEGKSVQHILDAIDFKTKIIKGSELKEIKNRIKSGDIDTELINKIMSMPNQIALDLLKELRSKLSILEVLNKLQNNEEITEADLNRLDEQKVILEAILENKDANISNELSIKAQEVVNSTLESVKIFISSNQEFLTTEEIENVQNNLLNAYNSAKSVLEIIAGNIDSDILSENNFIQELETIFNEANMYYEDMKNLKQTEIDSIFSLPKIEGFVINPIVENFLITDLDLELKNTINRLHNELNTLSEKELGDFRNNIFGKASVLSEEESDNLADYLFELINKHRCK